MPKVAKVSISIPADTLRWADRERRSTGESRSELFRRAVVQLLEGQREQQAVERYVAGYIAKPEVGEEADYVDEISQELLVGEPW